MHLYAIESRLNWSRQSLNGGRHYRIEHNEPENLICSKVNFWFRWEKGRKVKDHFIFSFRKWRGQCTVVELSTRTAFLNIDQSLQFRIFWSQSKALFMIRCMLSAGSGSKTFGALKVTICVNFFELSVHKMSNFLRISAFQWTMPSGLFAKKNHSKLFCSC